MFPASPALCPVRVTMEEHLDESYKVCGFCSQLTDEADRLSPALLNFLSGYLGVSASQLPLMVCTDCHRRSINAKKFSDKCHRAFQKLEKNGITGILVWGRSRADIQQVEDILRSNGHGNRVEWNEPSVGIEYDRKIHGPLMFPRITLTADDRAMAEAHMEKSKSGRIVKRKYEILDDDFDWDVDIQKKVKSEPVPANPKPAKPQPQPDPEPELSDCGEVFPAVGPYQCEICKNITNTKQDFVNHIKAKHRSMIDPAVLKTLEADLRKRKKKLLKKSGKFPAQKKKSKGRKKSLESDSDEEYLGVGVRKYQFSSQNIKYIDEEGNPLPKAAGKLPGSCNICGKTISRGNEMYKHQQSLSCRTIALEKGEDGHKTEAMIVVIRNFNELKNSKKSDTDNLPSFKSEMTKRYEAETDKDPGDYDEDYDDGQDEEVDSAIKAAVAASLETAREDLNTAGPAIGQAEAETVAEVVATSQPSAEEVSEAEPLFPEFQPAFQSPSNLLWSNMWQ